MDLEPPPPGTTAAALIDFADEQRALLTAGSDR